MKFVSNKIERVRLQGDRNFNFKFPPYHRSTVGIFPGSNVFITPIRETREVLFTTIDPKSWGDLWTLEMSLFEAKGSLKKIVDILAENKVNILVQESLTENTRIDEKADHRVHFIIDLDQYESELDFNTTFRRRSENRSFVPNDLISNIISNTKDILNKKDSGNGWKLSFRRMDFFFNHQSLARESFPATSRSNGMEVPSNIFEPMTGEADEIIYHVTSDSEEKYIKLGLIKENRC